MVRDLPKGVQKITRMNRHGERVTKYRVQIQHEGQKKDKVYASLDEAIEYVNASRSVTGRSQIQLLEERQKLFAEHAKRVIESPGFDYYCQSYRMRYILPKYEEYLLNPKSAESKFKLRQLTAEESFFRTICNTEIRALDRDLEKEETFKIPKVLLRPQQDLVRFGDLNPHEISAYEINQYIITRMRKIRPVSVERELTFISNVFRKIHDIDPDLAGMPNPVKLCDKDLLKARKAGIRSTRPITRISKSDQEEMFRVLNLRENKELYQCIRLMLFTGLRRSEAVLLRRENIFDNHIYLPYSKNGKPRTIYLIPFARDVLKEIEIKEDGRLFSFTVASFASQFLKCMRKHKLPHIKPHMLRKEFISNMVEEMGVQNSLVLATILGNDVQHLEKAIRNLPISKPIETQKELLESVGHKDPRVTQKHYLKLSFQNTDDGEV